MVFNFTVFYYFCGIMTKHVYAIVLAAGLSTRMGRPKQLLPFGDKTILQTVVDTLLATDLEGVVVVLGHEAEAVRESLGDRSVLFCLNDRYQEGMLSSVLCGIAHALQPVSEHLWERDYQGNDPPAHRQAEAGNQDVAQ